MPSTSPAPKVKFATQADPAVLDALRHMAAAEGRQLQALVDEALREYIERKASDAPRKHVMRALGVSMAQFDSVYKELAK